MFILALTTMLSLFLCIGVGFFAAKKNIINNHSLKHLNSFLINITLPFMMINILNIDLTKEILQTIPLAIFSGFLYNFILFLSAISFVKLLKIDFTKKDIVIFSLIFTNIGFIGIPLIGTVLGQESLMFTTLLNIPFNILTFTLGVIILDPSEHKKINIKKIITQPAIIGITIGLILLLSQTFTGYNSILPDFLSNSIRAIGNITSPLAMIIVGVSLVDVKFKELFLNFKLQIITIINLIIAPAIVYFILSLLLDNQMAINVCTIVSALPSATMLVPLSESFGIDYKYASELVFSSTLYSIITLPLLFFILF